MGFDFNCLVNHTEHVAFLRKHIKDSETPIFIVTNNEHSVKLAEVKWEPDYQEFCLYIIDSTTLRPKYLSDIRTFVIEVNQDYENKNKSLEKDDMGFTKEDYIDPEWFRE